MKSFVCNSSITKLIIAVLLVTAMVFAFFGCGSSSDVQAKVGALLFNSYTPLGMDFLDQAGTDTKPESDPIVNVLTGKRGLKKHVIDTRIVAIVVENHPAARPQWGMDDEKYSPDVILEGEVEGGISRMLWMYADYTKLPEIIGPVRSARPPYIKFSELFDAFFVHWGMSHTEQGYIGADRVFREDNVAHMNGMQYVNSGPFGRMSGTGRAVEHTGILYGDKVASALEDKFTRTAFNNKKTTKLKFFENKKPRGKKGSCYGLSLKFSSISGTTDWTYNKEDKKYYSNSFQNKVARDNLLVLFDETNYITKPGYTTYCNYNFKGGDAYYASCGAYQKIKWRIKNGKLFLYKEVDSKEKAVKLNPGKTWIGWASSNYNGHCDITARQ